jgi:hypothetical protein
MQVHYGSFDSSTCEQNESGSVKRDIMLEVVSSILGYAPHTKSEIDKCKAAGRVLAWLGMATVDKKRQFNCKPGYLLKLYGGDWQKGKIESTKESSSSFDKDCIDSILDAGLGRDSTDEEIRGFVSDVLGVLRLLCYAKNGGQVPTKLLKKIAVWRRSQEREMQRRCRCNTDTKVVKWLAVRKEAGLHIDPETAEVTGNYGQILDPYGVDPYLPAECQQGGWDHFARAVGVVRRPARRDPGNPRCEGRRPQKRAGGTGKRPEGGPSKEILCRRMMHRPFDAACCHANFATAMRKLVEPETPLGGYCDSWPGSCNSRSKELFVLDAVLEH